LKWILEILFEKVCDALFFASMEDIEVMVTKKDIEPVKGEPLDEELWLTYSEEYLNDPFIQYLSLKFKSNLNHSELAINESLLHLYKDGMVEVQMSGEGEPAIRLTSHGGLIMAAQMTATFGPIAEA